MQGILIFSPTTLSHLPPTSINPLLPTFLNWRFMAFGLDLYSIKFNQGHLYDHWIRTLL